VSLDGLKAPIDLSKEGGAEPRVLKVVVLRGLVQLMLGEPVKFGSAHSSQLGPSVPKHVGGWPAGTWCRVPSSIAAIGFLCPETIIFLVRQSFEALKELLGQPRPRLRGQLEDFGLDVVDAHTRDSTSYP
jgi:hypothetical protein